MLFPKAFSVSKSQRATLRSGSAAMVLLSFVGVIACTKRDVESTEIAATASAPLAPTPSASGGVDTADRNLTSRSMLPFGRRGVDWVRARQPATEAASARMSRDEALSWWCDASPRAAFEQHETFEMFSL